MASSAISAIGEKKLAELLTRDLTSELSSEILTMIAERLGETKFAELLTRHLTSELNEAKVELAAAKDELETYNNAFVIKCAEFDAAKEELETSNNAFVIKCAEFHAAKEEIAARDADLIAAKGEAEELNAALTAAGEELKKMQDTKVNLELKLTQSKHDYDSELEKLNDRLQVKNEENEVICDKLQQFKNLANMHCSQIANLQTANQELQVQIDKINEHDENDSTKLNGRTTRANTPKRLGRDGLRAK
jgi:hypothetical protein